jgi:hypothetical protein
MSGMYNMIMGPNPVIGYLYAMVGIHKDNYRQFGRLRDAWIDEDGMQIHVLHRNYPGGSAGAEDALEAAKSLPGYVDNTPDEDGTYGYWTFDVDPKYEHLALVIAEETDNTPCMERFRQVIADMQAGKDTPEVARALTAGKEIMAALTDTMKNGGRQEVSNADGSVVIEHIGGDKHA